MYSISFCILMMDFFHSPEKIFLNYSMFFSFCLCDYYLGINFQYRPKVKKISCVAWFGCLKWEKTFSNSNFFAPETEKMSNSLFWWKFFFDRNSILFWYLNQKKPKLTVEKKTFEDWQTLGTGTQCSFGPLGDVFFGAIFFDAKLNRWNVASDELEKGGEYPGHI